MKQLRKAHRALAKKARWTLLAGKWRCHTDGSRRRSMRDAKKLKREATRRLGVALIEEQIDDDDMHWLFMELCEDDDED